ncbi:RNA 2'-phosphotransferase [Actinopolymorpha pittospori]|uniref:Probable RNA 2'-phosphotransferase n=1 Tax=Actinopolymorpha pittospori TaxID=648752 RepID=A0A927MQJ2_9ACTN|nr:RNA 2'-phosphotransferase [Actinopolymorpha pittospori]MBE1604372.1 putative RNA 2'-phosphotransferase [Actinopolymorpha pittospori]
MSGGGSRKPGLRVADLSKAVAYALRHEPWLFELELDALGWTSLDALVAGLRRERCWDALTVEDVEAMVASATKRRYEIHEGRIRALYGHSVPGRIVVVRGIPPAVLFHGTSPDAAEAIRTSGLRPMGRQYVHLSVDEATARAVGGRKASRPVILTVAAGDAASRGVVFYAGNEKVWLADQVPPDFITG